MILYVNGEDQSSGAEVANSFSVASDDYTKVALGTKPHPENLQASWGMHLSKMLALALVCDAVSGSSNEQILQTTYEFIDSIEQKKYPYVMVVIGWADWDKNPAKQVALQQEIWELHQYLNMKRIPHLFFNAGMTPNNLEELHWGNCFIDPYDKQGSFISWSLAQGYEHNARYHFKRDAHLAWANYLFKWLTKIGI